MSFDPALSARVAATVAHTPPWVWALLAALVLVGALQLRAHEASPRRVILLPLAMGVLSLWSALAAFGLRADVFAAWALGLGVLLLWRPQGPRHVRHDPQRAVFLLPASAVPLLLMLAVFAVRYAVGVTRALQPAFAQTPAFAIGAALGYGLLSGLFAARAINVLASARPARAAPHR